MKCKEVELLERNLSTINDILEMRSEAVRAVQSLNTLIEEKLYELDFLNHKSIRMVPKQDPSLVVAFIKRHDYVEMKVYENTDRKPPGALGIMDLMG